MMLKYPDYQVEKIETFFDLFEMMKDFNNIAFINHDNKITYAHFVEDIKKVISAFKEQRRFVLCCCSDKYYFVVAYFAIVLSDNIACLQPSNMDTLSCYEKFDFLCTVDDLFITKALDGEAIEIIPATDKDNLCTVLCSSGTTATPKAVGLSQYNIITDLVAGMEKYEFKSNGRYVNILPYSHSFGVVCDLLGPLYSCSTIAFAYNPVEFFSLLPIVNPTALNIIPALVDVLDKQINVSASKELVVGNSLTKILSGGAGTPSALCEKMKENGIEIYGCYGLTECAPCVSVNRDNANKYGSAGVLLNCNTISINENGEISIRGTNVMKGYLDEHGKCLPLLNNTFETGDIGYLDEEGYLFIIGRCDDMIVFANGTKLMPTTIEAQINLIPGVLESVVYKKDDKLYGQIAVADETLIDAIRTSILNACYGDFRLSNVICSTESLPKNAMGKINRKHIAI